MMTTAETQTALREHLEDLVRVRQDSETDLRTHGFAYTCPEDFVLQHGIWYQPRKLPRDVRRGPPKQCYGNALLAAASRGWRYVEGYAIAIIPVQHAWVLDARERLYEVTWPAPGLAYLGVEFSLARAEACIWHGDATVLDDYQRHWPLLRQPWTGENPLAVWEPSPWLAMLRDGQIREAHAWVLAHRHDVTEG